MSEENGALDRLLVDGVSQQAPKVTYGSVGASPSSFLPRSESPPNEFSRLLTGPTADDLFTETTSHFKECYDVVQHVVGFLPNTAAVRARLVSHTWKAAVDDSGTPARMTKLLREGLNEHNEEMDRSFGGWLRIRKWYMIFTLVYPFLLLLPMIVFAFQADFDPSELKVVTFVVATVMVGLMILPPAAVTVSLLRNTPRHKIRSDFMLELLVFILVVSTLAAGSLSQVSSWTIGESINRQGVELAECGSNWTTHYPSFVLFQRPLDWVVGDVTRMASTGVLVYMLQYQGPRQPCQASIPRGCLGITTTFDLSTFLANHTAINGAEPLLLRTVENSLFHSTVEPGWQWSLNKWKASNWWVEYQMPLVTNVVGHVDTTRSRQYFFFMIGGYAAAVVVLNMYAALILGHAWIALERRKLKIPFSFPSVDDDAADDQYRAISARDRKPCKHLAASSFDWRQPCNEEVAKRLRRMEVNRQRLRDARRKAKKDKVKNIQEAADNDTSAVSFTSP